MFTDTTLFLRIVTMFLLAFAIAFVLTPLSIKLAYKIGAVDVPLDKRRMHSRPIPRFGGIAMFLSATISILLLDGSFPKIQIALIGGAFMYLLGAIDDLKNLKPLTKATGQVVIACFVYMMDIRIEFISMVFLVIGNVPLLYMLNKAWFNSLMNTVLGQIVLAVSAVAIFISTAIVIRLTKPIEYKR